jgi:hypothetical protein
MPEETFVVISCSEDGDVRIQEWSKKDLLEKVLGEHYYGTTECFTRMPRHNDPQEWGERKLLILRGGVVVPKPVETVTKYEVE